LETPVGYALPLKWDEQKLKDEAGTVSCPYDIDVPRKTRLTLAKLNGGNADII
jgi:hypothetical protein